MAKSRGLPETLRHRMVDHFKYKYRNGIMMKEKSLIEEMPYDMQVRYSARAL